MATLPDIRHAALALPGAVELESHGGSWFNVGKKTFVLYWAKEILVALLIVSFFWMLAGLVSASLNRWGKRLARFTETDLDDRILQRIIPHISRLLTMSGFCRISVLAVSRLFSSVSPGRPSMVWTPREKP